MNSVNTFAIITGASGGIGYELTTLMASKGHNLIIVARSGSRLAQIASDLQSQYNVRILPFAADLAMEAERLKLIEYIRRNNYSINILVNNAGFGYAGYFAKFGYKRMMKGRKRAIQGIKNNLMIFALRFIPTEFTNPILKRLHRK